MAVQTSGGVFLSWRMLATDPDGIGFNIYRNNSKLNSSPITTATSYLDSGGTSSSSYWVVPVVNGTEWTGENPGSVWSNQYKTVNLSRPSGGTSPDGVAYTYSPNDLSVADLDGDGALDIVVKWDPSNAKDNSQSGYTGNVFVDGYKIDGTRLWRIDLGRNIRAGAHYTQFLAYDFDGDGKAEVMMKTADGTKAGNGTVIGSSSADYRNSSGYVLSGPEYLTVFNGQTGAVLASTDYLPARGTVSSWGDSYGNRVDRFLAGVAYLDGKRPSAVFTRGYYTRAVLVAWDYRNGSLSRRWTFDSNNNSSYNGQGAHSLSIADVDNDGKDEVIFGAAAIDDNGSGLYSTGRGHGDALHVGDFNPNRSGLEAVMPHESPSAYGNHGIEMRDARTGSIIGSMSGEGVDVGRGVVGDIDSRYPGAEFWGSKGTLMSAAGVAIGAKPSQINFMAWWDGDLMREILDGTTISKWNQGSSSTLLSAGNNGAASNNGTKSNPGISGDILGDWREEVIWRHSDNDKLLIFTTTIPTSYRFFTLLHDPQYRVALSWQNVGYNQPPHPSFYLGTGMSQPVRPNVYTP